VVTASKIYCFRGDQLGGDGQFGVDQQRKKSVCEPFDPIYCGACGKVVTSRDQEISISGSHTHTFFNPAGIVFELACFRSAPGCLVVGETTLEFTWFSGHSWRFGLCLSCDAHLGWLYETGDHFFYGLILPRLRH
jgi:hypothetical protein